MSNLFSTNLLFKLIYKNSISSPKIKDLRLISSSAHYFIKFTDKMYKIQKFDDRGYLKQTWVQHKLQSKLQMANTITPFDFQQITYITKQHVCKFWTKLKNIGLNIVNKFKFQNPQLIVTVNQNQKLENLLSDKDSKDQYVCDERRERKKQRQKIRNRSQSCEPLDLVKLKEVYIPSNAFIKIPKRKQQKGNKKKVEQYSYWRKNRLNNNLSNQDQQIVQDEFQSYSNRNTILLQEQRKYENKDYNIQEHIKSNSDIDLPSMTIEERELWLEETLTSLRSRIQKRKQKDCTHKSDSFSFIVSQSDPSLLSTTVPQQKSPLPQNNPFSSPRDSPSNNDLQKYSSQQQLQNLNGVMADIFFSSDSSSITKLSLSSRLQVESQENRFVLVEGEEGSDERNFELDIFQQQEKISPLNSQ